jgi:hypothetical protein
MFGGNCSQAQIGKLVTLLLVVSFLLLSSGGTSGWDRYPTPYSFNEDRILDHYIWHIFVSIDGFNNTPNADGYGGYPVVVQLNDSAQNTHTFTFTCSSNYSSQKYTYDEALTYSKANGTGEPLFNLTLSASFGGYDCWSYYLTVALDENQVIHVFTEKYEDKEDVPLQFWLYHSSVTQNGDIVSDDKLFYYEKKGGCGLCYYYPWWICAAAVPFVAMMVILAIRAGYRRGKE